MYFSSALTIELINQPAPQSLGGPGGRHFNRPVAKIETEGFCDLFTLVEAITVGRMHGRASLPTRAAMIEDRYVLNLARLAHWPCLVGNRTRVEVQPFIQVEFKSYT